MFGYALAALLGGSAAANIQGIRTFVQVCKILYNESHDLLGNDVHYLAESTSYRGKLNLDWLIHSIYRQQRCDFRLVVIVSRVEECEVCRAAWESDVQLNPKGVIPAG